MSNSKQTDWVSTSNIYSLPWFPWLVCGLGALFYSYEYLLRVAPSVMTTELMMHFNISAESLGNLVAFYYYAYAPSQIFVGILIDRYGPRRVLTLACLLCALGTYVFATTPNLNLASFGRFLVGLGSAFAFVGVLKLATIWLPPNRFAMVAGLTSALGTIGAMFSQVMLTSFVSALGWEHSTLLSAGLGVILAIILFMFVKDGSKEIDNKYHHHSVNFKDIFIGLGRILKNPFIWINGLVGCLLYLPTSAFAELWGNPYFQTAHGYTGQQAAFAISAIFLGFTVGGPINGWISDKIGQRFKPMVIGGLLAALTMSAILYIPGIPIFVNYFLLFLLGIFYSVQVIVFAVGREISPENTAGTALAVTNALVMLGGVVFQPAIGLLLEWQWTGTLIDQLHVYSAKEYNIAMSALPISLFLSALLVFFLKNAKPAKDV